MIPFHCASPLYNHMIQASRGASSAVYVTDFKTPKLPKINQMLAFPSLCVVLCSIMKLRRKTNVTK